MTKTVTVGAENRLRELGIELPPAPTPLGAYVETVQTGDLLFLSGMLPLAGGKRSFSGGWGRNWTIERDMRRRAWRR